MVLDITQRRNKIVSIVNKDGSAKISDISVKLNVTRETIRKDIYDLDQQGLIQAVRGGAIISDGISETQFGQRKNLCVQEKKEIAKKALRFINNGDSIFLDSGTTSFEMAEAIKKSNLKNITVITNSTLVISSLEFVKGIQLILLGGILRSSEGSVSGPITLDNAKKIYADVGFFGSGGINTHSGITNPYIEETETSKKMLEHCSIGIVLADHTKFGKNSLYEMFSLTDVDVIITDSKIDSSVIEDFGLNNLYY